MYVQVRPRAVVRAGQRLTVGDIALVTDKDGAFDKAASALYVPCPKNEGVWSLPAVAVIRALKKGVGEELVLLGESVCYVHVVREEHRNKTHVLRTALAFLFLLLGSAQAICWFQADVSMWDAQTALYRLLAGTEPKSPLLIVLPYTLGVGLGVAVFYALIGRKKTVSPLDIQLDKYRKDAEETAGETP